MASASASLIMNLFVKNQSTAGLKDAESGFKSTATKIAGALAAIGAIEIFKGFINDARESAQVARITQAAIESTGGAAQVTADQIAGLAMSLSNKTGADHKAIQSGENLLLTFTNIRNGIGAGNDIFNQATATVVDMAAALHNGDVSADGLKETSIQLGKALNDPIAGVSALAEVGVTFTAQQKEQIKAMVQAGDTANAQKVILAELAREFGGAAQAAGDPMLKLQTTLKNTAEELGTSFLPALNSAANLLASFAEWAQKNETTVKFLAVTIGSLAGAVILINTANKAWEATTGALAVVQRVLGVQTAATTVATEAQVVATNAMTVSNDRARIATLLLNTAFLANPVVLITVAIVALVAVIVLIATKTTWFQQLWSAAWGAIQAAVSAVFNWVQDNWPLILGILTGPFGLAVLAITKWRDQITSVVVGAFDAVKNAAAGAVSWIQGNWPLLLAILTGPFGLAIAAVVKWKDQLAAVVMGAFDVVKNAAQAPFDWIQGNWPVLLAVITGPFTASVAAILKWKDEIGAAIQSAFGAFKGIPGMLPDLAGQLSLVGRNIGGGLLAGIASSLDSVSDVFGEVPTRIYTVLKGGGSTLLAAGHDIVLNLANGINSVSGWMFDFITSFPMKTYNYFKTTAKTILMNAGTWIVGWVRDGIKSMGGALWDAFKAGLGKIASLLPGSPVKAGPLRVLNNGYAGAQIVKMLAAGITKEADTAALAMSAASKRIADASNVRINGRPTVPFTGGVVGQLLGSDLTRLTALITGGAMGTGQGPRIPTTVAGASTTQNDRTHAQMIGTAVKEALQGSHWFMDRDGVVRLVSDDIGAKADLYARSGG